MPELKCPHCGKTFVVEDTELNSIVPQILILGDILPPGHLAAGASLVGMQMRFVLKAHSGSFP